MMDNVKRTLLIVIALSLAGILQFGVAPAMAIRSVEPDFLLIVQTIFALACRPSVGATCGFVSGVLQGALAGANLTHYVTSRATTGFLTSLARGTELDFGPVLGALAVATATVVSRIIFMFFAAPHGIADYLQATMLVAIYNAVIAMPAYSVVSQLLKPKKV